MGIGVEKNEKMAVLYYKLAADKGLAQAQNDLGICYYKGIGVDKDLKRAADWFALAANQGFREAQFSLGNCYQRGKGVEKNIEETIRFYKLAAGQGLKDAEMLLNHLMSEGVKQDKKEAKQSVDSSNDALPLNHSGVSGGSGVAQNNLKLVPLRSVFLKAFKGTRPLRVKIQHKGYLINFKSTTYSPYSTTLSHPIGLI